MLRTVQWLRNATHRTSRAHQVEVRFARFAFALLIVAGFLLPVLTEGSAPASVIEHSVRSSRSSSKPVVGGTLIYLEQGAATTLYPPSSGSYTAGGIISNITDRLVYQDPQTLKLEPWLATGWQWNPTDTAIIFYLRKGVTFSNGTPFNADVAKADFDTYGLGNSALGLTKSEDINHYSHSLVINPYEIEFFFTAPSPGFLQGTATVNEGIVSLSTIQQNLNAFALATNVIGTGPFVATNEIVNQETDLVARKDYNWAPPSLAHQGRAYLDEIRYVIEPEDSVRVGALEAGQGDVLRAVPPFDETQLKGAGFKLYAPQTLGVDDSITFRPTNPLVSDVLVREAITHAVNLEQIHKALFTSNYPVPKSILSDLASGFLNTSKYYTYDPTLSEKLLNEDGWVLGSNGIREKNGQELSLNAYYQAPGGQPDTEQTLELFAEQEANIGVQINILSPTSPNEATLIKNPADTPLFIADAGRADRDILASYFSCTDRDELETCIPSLERLFYEEETAVGYAQSVNFVHQEQIYLGRNYLSIPILQEPQVFAAAPYVKGLGFNEVGRPAFYSTWLAPH
jgi:peptide/nickel transport system substrate-binding protein